MCVCCGCYVDGRRLPSEDTITSTTSTTSSSTSSGSSTLKLKVTKRRHPDSQGHFTALKEEEEEEEEDEGEEEEEEEERGKELARSDSLEACTPLARDSQSPK